MEIEITKLGAAERQLITAIRLFFKDDNASFEAIHTLTWASLNILHDHIPPQEALQANSILHFNNPYVREEFKKVFHDQVKALSNFLKHADKDLKAGRDKMTVNSAVNDFNILDAIQCLKYVQNDEFHMRKEYSVFILWLISNKPSLYRAELLKGDFEIDKVPSGLTKIECLNLLEIIII